MLMDDVCRCSGGLVRRKVQVCGMDGVGMIDDGSSTKEIEKKDEKRDGKGEERKGNAPWRWVREREE